MVDNCNQTVSKAVLGYTLTISLCSCKITVYAVDSSFGLCRQCVCACVRERLASLSSVCVCDLLV